MKGSQNVAGISDPVIDALIDKIIAADSRMSLTTACGVLDRVIRSGNYWVPHWYKASHWLAYWDVFGRPAIKPRYARGVPETRKGSENRSVNQVHPSRDGPNGAGWSHARVEAVLVFGSSLPAVATNQTSFLKSIGVRP
jgi:hypothetical protein